MGRRDFLSHLAEASTPGAFDNLHNIHSVDEGVISCRFECVPGDHQRKPGVNIQVCATNPDDYPDGNSYAVFTNDDLNHELIPQALQKLSDRAKGWLLPELLAKLSQDLIRCTTPDKLEACESQKLQPDGDLDDEFDFDFEEDSDVDFGFEETVQTSPERHRAGVLAGFTSDTATNTARLRADLAAVKQAGFRYGVFGSLQNSGVLCVSIRISKLELSEEALRAWNVQRNHYLLLMIRYPHGYRYTDQVKEATSFTKSTQLKVYLCDHYKPLSKDVLSCFNISSFEPSSGTSETGAKLDMTSSLEPLFIDKPLNHLLSDFLPWVLKARLNAGLSWLGAEMFVQAYQKSAVNYIDGNMDRFRDVDDLKANTFPEVMMADHIAQAPRGRLSYPLIAMQFVLRHFVRCTEFCLVCYHRLEDTFEALKPYVCSNPLCLYQYMSLGFGPKIEWEILTQPDVVDLLVSFCYTAAQQDGLKEFPVGMNLLVPVLPKYTDGLPCVSSSPRPNVPPFTPLSMKVPDTPPQAIHESFKCRWKVTENEMVVVEDHCSKAKNLKPGCWVFLSTGSSLAHCRVGKVTLPLVRFSETNLIEPDSLSISPGEQTAATNAALFQRYAAAKPALDGVASKCYMYEHNFDDLSKPNQHQTILTLLKSLPSIDDMRIHLQTRGHNAELRSWVSKISDSALSVLRWIIASNRSCVMQVDQIDEKGAFVQPVVSCEDRVGGMERWIQFRFAQGAPDKEKRFLECIDRETMPSAQYPTLFAWHGSRLRNWHSIIRTGLRFDDVVNGRAYGNGVYLSPHAITSLGYSTIHGTGRGYTPTYDGWPLSKLRIINAFSLNEVVNQPNKFVHTNPHYVVDNIDWIQTRYLFVKSATQSFCGGEPSTCYEQDPLYRARNEASEPIKIPIAAVSKSRRPGWKTRPAEVRLGKRSKVLIATDQATAERFEDDAESMVSDDEDLALLAPEDVGVEHGFSDDSSKQTDTKGKKRAVEEDADTDFVAGSLDTSNIRFLQAPRDATTASTQALMRSFREVLAVQAASPLSRLGWYIDSNLVSNMYQWIVELHSFPPHLPLAQDMKKAGLTSVVLEVRFSHHYPFTPPFIRVVKPRFLPFAMGGGGNVTEGGAMCMEVLTNTGWTAAQAIDGLLLQVRMAICDEERPARLVSTSPGQGQSGGTYGVGEAVAAYIRACKNHGWTVPAGFEKMSLE